jgi:hypothetical protein
MQKLILANWKKVLTLGATCAVAAATLATAVTPASAQPGTWHRREVRRERRIMRRDHRIWRRERRIVRHDSRYWWRDRHGVWHRRYRRY